MSLYPHIIGDEIWVDGYLFGLVTSHGMPESVRDMFLSDIEAGLLFEDDRTSEYDEALNDCMKAAELESKGGLLRVADLRTIITQLKETDS